MSERDGTGDLTGTTPGTGASAGSGAARSLADDLRSRDDAQLAALLRARPDLTYPVPADLGALATRAATPTSVARALDRLDRGTLQVLEALSAMPEPADLTALHTGIPGAPAAYLDGRVQHLREQALLWGADDDLRLVRSVRSAFGEYPAGLGPAMATARRGVAAYAGDPALVVQMVEQAPAQAKAALDELLWGPPVGRLEHADRAVSVTSAATAVEWLLSRHLLEPLDEHTVVLPREAALALRAGVLVRQACPVPPAVAERARYEPARVDATAGAQAYRFVRAVADLLTAWSGAPPAVLRSGGLGVRDLARSATTLDLDEGATAVVIETAYAAGLLAADDDLSAGWCPTPAYDAWLARPVGEQWALLAGAWLRTARTPVLAQGRDESGARPNVLSRDLDRPGTPHARRRVLAALAAQPPGTCPDEGDLLELLAWQRPRQQAPSQTLVARASLREAELFGVTGLRALSTYGRLLLATPAADELSAQGRASTRAPGQAPVAADVVAALTPHLPQLLDHVLLQADLTAVAPGPLEPALSTELALVADVESTGAATVYRFSEHSVRRALDAGRSTADVLAMLTRHSTTAVPQSLEYLIGDVGRRHGAVRVGVASAYVRCDDPAVIAAALADRRLATLRLRRLADTVLCAQAPPDEVLALLREVGLAPSAETPDGAVVVATPQRRRTPSRPRPRHPGAEPPPPTPALIDAAVRAMRAGEHSAAHRPTQPTGPDDALGRSDIAQTLEVLRGALDSTAQVWIGYADPTGTTSERVVEPLRLSGGFLTAYDLRTASLMTFTVARITAAAPVARTDER
jgi:hypothetical protein